jgi:hypothetical protein
VQGDTSCCGPNPLVGSRFENRGARIRTGDLGHPKAARYQAAPRPDGISLEARGAAAARSQGGGASLSGRCSAGRA